MKLAFVALFVLGAALRLLLAWFNHPGNAFDDHYEPITLQLMIGALPPKDACYQCYHPPGFYWISAQVGRAALLAGADGPQFAKLLQLVGCLYGILTVAVCYFILRKFPLPPFAQLAAFGTVCLLPRHVYMSAMHSNDTLAYLLIALSVYATIVMLERGFSRTSIAVLTLLLTLAIFTKYTAFALLPAVAVAVACACRGALIPSAKRWLALSAATLALPLVVLSAHMAWNTHRYGVPLPSNFPMHDPTSKRPADPQGASFLTFKPWLHVPDPALAPGKLHSFWTLLHIGAWSDMEPYFLPHLDWDPAWWPLYISWYRGEAAYPGANPSLSAATRLTASGLIVLGLVPLGLLGIGLGAALGGRWPRSAAAATAAQSSALRMMPVLAILSIAGVILATAYAPSFVVMKTSYVLASTPALAVLLALGVAWCEADAIRKRVCAALFGALFALCVVHLATLVYAMARA